MRIADKDKNLEEISFFVQITKFVKSGGGLKVNPITKVKSLEYSTCCDL